MTDAPDPVTRIDMIQGYVCVVGALVSIVYGIVERTWTALAGVLLMGCCFTIVAGQVEARIRANRRNGQ